MNVKPMADAVPKTNKTIIKIEYVRKGINLDICIQQ